MTSEDQALSACLDARDYMFRAIRLIKSCRNFDARALDALVAAEDANTVAINIQLELRRTERVAA